MYLGPLMLTFAIAVFVLLMQFLWKYIDDMVGKGLGVGIILQLLFYASSTFIPMALPLAILLASLMTFGNFGENYELVAAKAAGISLRKVMMPLILLSLFISGIAFLFSNNVLPYANLKMWSLLHDVREQKPALNIKEGVFYKDIENYVIKVGKKNKDGKNIERVIIYDHTRPGGNNNVTFALTGTMETTSDKRFLILTLRDGFNYDEPHETRSQINRKPLQTTSFKEQIMRFDLSGFSLSRTNEELFKENQQMMNIKQLQMYIDSFNVQLQNIQKDFGKQFTGNFYYLSVDVMRDSTWKILPDSLNRSFDQYIKSNTMINEAQLIDGAAKSASRVSMIIDNHEENLDFSNKQLIRFRVEWYRKFTLSIACLILFFIGAPLGAIIRKGGLGLPLVVSIIVFIIYYVISIMGEKFVKDGIMMPAIGMWLSSAVLLPFGLWLTLKSTTDSPLMDADGWKKKLDGLKRIWRKKKA